MSSTDDGPGCLACGCIVAMLAIVGAVFGASFAFGQLIVEALTR